MTVTQEKIAHLHEALKKTAINTIQNMLLNLRCSSIGFTEDFVVAFTDDGENAFVREILSIDSNGTITYNVPEFETGELEMIAEDEEVSMEVLIKIIGEIEKHHWYKIEVGN